MFHINFMETIDSKSKTPKIENTFMESHVNEHLKSKMCSETFGPN